MWVSASCLLDNILSFKDLSVEFVKEWKTLNIATEMKFAINWTFKKCQVKQPFIILAPHNILDLK